MIIDCMLDNGQFMYIGHMYALSGDRKICVNRIEHIGHYSWTPDFVT